MLELYLHHSFFSVVFTHQICHPNSVSFGMFASLESDSLFHIVDSSSSI
uniref:Uncharacterized protein n=1 Tax=Rhizophora mucronata TaxID=61149 RepID=A0A2P2QZE2_RHIMU